MKALLRSLVAIGLILCSGAAFAQTVTRNIATSQASIVSTAGGTQAVAARANRVAVTIQNHSSVAIYCGPTSPTITTSNGFRLPAVDGASLTLETSAAVQCISASGTNTVSVMEAY